MRKIFGLVAGFVLIFTLTVVSSAPATAAGTVTVTHANMQNWAFEGPDEGGNGGISSGGFVSGPPGSLGAGSAHFVLGNQAGGMFLATPQFHGTPFSTLTQLTFETYTTNTGKDVALDMDVDFDPNAPCASLIRPQDPVGSCYQGRFNFVPAFNAAAIQTGTWQFWDTLNPAAKDWYASHGVPGHATMCTQAAPCSMSDLLAVYPNAAIMQRSGPGQFGVKAGSSYSSFDGNTDNIIIGISGVNTTFDFEPGGPAATLNVRPDGEDSVCNGSANVAVSAATFPNCAFKTINGALAQAVAGDTIAVHAGTYAEQVNITKNLTLTGDGAATTKIQVPAAPTANVPSPNSTGTGYSLVALSGNTTLTMSNLTVNGPWTVPGSCDADFFGITAYGGSTLNLSNATVSNIINSDPSLYGCQQGDAIRVGRTSISQTGHASINNVTVTGYQKTGIIVDAVGSSGTMDHNIVTGPGPNTPLSNIIAMNGIQISRGATASVTNNTVTNNVCDAAGGGCGPDPITGTQSAGILIYNADGLTIQGNTLSGNDMGIYNFSSSTAGAAISKAGKGGKSKVSPSDPGPRKSIVAAPTPSLITGNTVQNNRYENIFLDEGTVTLATNTISGSQIGVEVASFNPATEGTDGNSQGVLTGNTISGATVAGVQLQLESGATFIAKINGHSNKITTTTGVNNTTGTVVDLTKNWWGNQSGPTNATNVGGTGASVSSNVTFSPWCGDAACTTFFGIPTMLVFTTQPGNAVALSPFGTQPVVKAEDAAGDLGINFTGQVTLGIGTNPAGGTLSGGQVNAVNGVATFTNAAIDKPGAGYTLTAAATGLTGTTSNAFTVSPPIPTITSVSPGNGGAGGNEVVTITGTNFVSGDTVTFGGTAGTNVTVNSSTKITVTNPVHAAGKVDVRVVNSNNQGNTLTNGYEYDAPNATTTGRPDGAPIVGVGVPAPAPTGRTQNPNPHP